MDVLNDVHVSVVAGRRFGRSGMYMCMPVPCTSPIRHHPNRIFSYSATIFHRESKASCSGNKQGKTYGDFNAGVRYAGRADRAFGQQLLSRGGFTVVGARPHDLPHLFLVNIRGTWNRCNLGFRKFRCYGVRSWYGVRSCYHVEVLWCKIP